MRKSKLIRFLIVFWIRLQLSVGLNNEVQMVLDVIKAYDRPTAVVGKVCWGLSDKMNLATELMDKGKPKTLQFINEYKTIKNFGADDIVIIVDLNCKDSGNILHQADENKKFKNPYRWLILHSENKTDDIPLELKNITVLIDSEVIIAQELENDKIILDFVYRIDPTGGFITEQFGVWTSENGLSLSESTKIAASIRRKNLRGKPVAISVVATDEETKTEIYNLNNLVTDNLGRSTFHNILPLYNFMNATTEVVFTDTWGYYINNSWNGMIGQVERGDADLAGTIMLMRAKRAEVMSFLTQPIHITMKFVFRKPPLSLQNNLFILPFKSDVWMTIGALFVLLLVVIYVNATWEIKKNGTVQKKDKGPTTLRPDFGDIAIFVAGAAVQQGSYIEMKGSLGRVVTFIMLLVFLFLYTSYSANIVALLQSNSDQIRTLSDLLHSKLELGVEDQPYTRHYFTTATDRVRKAIYDNKVARTGYKANFMSVEEGIKKLQNIETPFAFHMNLGIGYKLVEQYFHEHEKCGLTEIEYIPNSNPWVCCSKRSPYKEIYKIGLARIMEHGIGDRINQLIYARKPTCNSQGGSFRSVNMMDFHPVLLCLLYGMTASVLLLMLEILMYRKQKKIGETDEVRAVVDFEDDKE